MANKKSVLSSLALIVSDTTFIPFPRWMAKKSHRVVTTLRSSPKAQNAVRLATGICISKILDPKGPLMLTLTRHKTIGPAVKIMITHERYLEFVDYLATASGKLATRAFTVQDPIMLSPEDVKTLPDTKALPAPPTVSRSWATDDYRTPTITFKGSPIS